MKRWLIGLLLCLGLLLGATPRAQAQRRYYRRGYYRPRVYRRRPHYAPRFYHAAPYRYYGGRSYYRPRPYYRRPGPAVIIRP